MSLIFVAGFGTAYSHWIVHRDDAKNIAEMAPQGERISEGIAVSERWKEISLQKYEECIRGNQTSDCSHFLQRSFEAQEMASGLKRDLAELKAR